MKKLLGKVVGSVTFVDNEVTWGYGKILGEVGLERYLADI